MYEKPQYMTPDGLRRLKKNPFGNKKAPPAPPARKKSMMVPRARRGGIDEKAARLIAEVLRSMLRQ